MVRALRMTPAQLSAMLSGGMVPGRRRFPPILNRRICPIEE